MKMSFISLVIFFQLLSSLVFSAPSISCRQTTTGFHTRLEYSIEPDPTKVSHCLFVWHRLPPYLYVEPDELYRINATIVGSINIETSTSQSHPFAYCFILYNSSKIPFIDALKFSMNIHSRYIDPTSDHDQIYQTFYLPEPVIHFTEKHCSYLGSGCPAPLAETGIESPRELTVTIPTGQEKHLAFVFPLTCFFPLIGCSLLFMYSETN